jgi:hypothetical protein
MIDDEMWVKIIAVAATGAIALMILGAVTVLDLAHTLVRAALF